MDLEMYKKMMEFCPCEVTYGESKIKATRCWEWVKEHGYKLSEPLNDDSKITNVWDLNNERLVVLNNDKIVFCGLCEHNGQRYFK